MTATHRSPWPLLSILFLGMLPALALWAYPGWLELAVGYTPYFNLHTWLGSSLLLWIPPFKVGTAVRLQVPVAYAVAGLFVSLGLPLLAALRASAVLALALAAGGVFAWTRERWGDWPALAAALTWLYSPAVGVLAFRLGYLGHLWLWAVVAWLLAAWARWSRRWRISGCITVRVVSAEVGLLLTWLVLLWPGVDAWVRPQWRAYALLLGLVALAAAPAAARLTKALSRFAPPWLIALMLAALAARLTLVATAPRYTQYVPPPWPVATFEQNIVLLDAHSDMRPAPGRTIYLTLTWQALEPQAKDWTTFAQVLGPNNRVWGQHDRPTGGDYPTSRWRVGEVVSETYTIAVADDAPRKLRLIVGLYDRATMQRLRTSWGKDYVDVSAR